MRADEMSEVLNGQHRLVVLAPHPDDEALGCGALLARGFAGQGAHIVCVTNGSASHPNSKEWPPARLAQCRQAELQTAVACLGGTPADVTWLGLPDGELYRLDPSRIASNLLRIMDACAARYIFVPTDEDHHEDHKVVAEVAQMLRCLHPNWAFYSYPVWCRWDNPHFDQDVLRHNPSFLELGEWRDKKWAAIKSHQSQLGQIVHDDPAGFTLPLAMVEKFVNADEIFWRMP